MFKKTPGMILDATITLFVYTCLEIALFFKNQIFSGCPFCYSHKVYYRENAKKVFTKRSIGFIKPPEAKPFQIWEAPNMFEKTPKYQGVSLSIPPSLWIPPLQKW